MGTTISASAVSSSLEAQNSSIGKVLSQIPAAISSINEYDCDTTLTSEAFKAHKAYLREGHLPFLHGLRTGLNMLFTANKTHIAAIGAHLSGYDFYDSNMIQANIDWANQSISRLEHMMRTQGQIGLRGELHSRQNFLREWIDRRNRLQGYLSATSSIYNFAAAALQNTEMALMSLEYADECKVLGTSVFILPTVEKMAVITGLRLPNGKPNWDLIETILAKPANGIGGITDMEYHALATFYTQTDDKYLARFLGLFAEKVDNNGYYFEGTENVANERNYFFLRGLWSSNLNAIDATQDYNYPDVMWVFNDVKLNRLHAAVEELAETNRLNQIAAFEIGDIKQRTELQVERNTQLERAALLMIVCATTGKTGGSELGEFGQEWERSRVMVGTDTGPAFQLYINEECENKYVFNYMSTERYAYTYDAGLKAFRVGSSSIETLTISEVMNGSHFESEFDRLTNDFYSTKYNFDRDAYISSAWGKLLIETFTGLALGELPHNIGDAIGFIPGIFNIYIETSKAEAESLRIQKDINSIYSNEKLGDFIKEFELEGVLISSYMYGDADRREFYPICWMSEDTETRLESFYSATSEDAFTVENFRKNSERAFEIYSNLRDSGGLKDVD